MADKSALRIAPGPEGVSIWSAEIFGGETGRIRDFVARAFQVDEVSGVEIRRPTAFGRIRYRRADDQASIWKKLSRALGAQPDAPPLVYDDLDQRFDARDLYLDGSLVAPVRVTRIGGALSTWRLRSQDENTLRLWHPALRNRRDIVFRLEEELAAILGVEDFRASHLTAGVAIRFDKNALNAGRLTQQLEKAWPKLLEGLEGPPSRRRLIAAGGLLGLAFTGQYLVPALRPVAVGGVLLYGAPNVVNGAKQLKRGEVGLSALYSTGMAFLLISGMPFASTVIAVLMQLWPYLTHQKIVNSQRRLFAAHRRRPAWARLPTADGIDVQKRVDDLVRGDLIVVRRGEIVATDGVVTEGAATVVDAAPFATDGVEDRVVGDLVPAGAFVVDGALTIRVARAAAESAASRLDALFPHAAVVGLPSSLEAERIANRNAKPALALSALNLALTRTLRPSQAVIRPDYATAPRLSAQLSTLQGLAAAHQRGVTFRSPSALDRAVGADIFVFDDTAGLDRRKVAVAEVLGLPGFSADLVVSYAAAASRTSRSERSGALAAAARRKEVDPRPTEIRRVAGATRYRDSLGSTIEVATWQYLEASKIAVPAQLRVASARNSDNTTRPLWVVRDGAAIGAVTFARSGALVARELLKTLAGQARGARFIHVSSKSEAEARKLADEAGIEFAYGGLDGRAKADFIRGLGRPTVWIGDGADAEARDAIAASTVSISVANKAHLADDLADVLSPRLGLDGVPHVVEVVRAHRKRIADDYRTVYAVNLLGIAGAFLMRFGSLQAGLLSNAGTGAIYLRRARDLDRLAAFAEADQSRLRAEALR